MARHPHPKKPMKPQIRCVDASGRSFFGLVALAVLAFVAGLNAFGFAFAVVLRFLPASAHPAPDTVPVYRLKRSLTVNASGFSSRAGQTDGTPCVTADGTDVCKRYFETQAIDTVATNYLPMGTVVKFPALFPNTFFTVRDRMNARYNGRPYVDIWMPTKIDAMMFGRRSVLMEVYE